MNLLSKVFKILFPLFIIIACSAAVYLSNYLKYIDSNDIKFINPKQKLASFKEITELPQFKNKVVVIDIWSVSCGPCLKQLKTAYDFKRKVASKDVVFLYISYNNRFRLDRQLKWKQIIGENKLFGYHLEVDSKLYDKLWTEINSPTVTSIAVPRYLILNKQGQLVNNNAAGLDSPQQFLQQIQSALDTTAVLAVR
ncbi:redoxin family protein [Solitalea sp. MAHUQ-68]|uniref:Redoxin family protein n=1 Tax=Solitalea agri TaxID=2953739 RepID=A0A9X2F5L4_9SPHI|nr:thioredoxin-like domain-containing protein [Solitalea agri]MCO4294741.1 redoxin family protein [Solitalea agri]